MGPTERSVLIFVGGVVVGLIAYATVPEFASFMDKLVLKPAQKVGLAKNA